MNYKLLSTFLLAGLLAVGQTAMAAVGYKTIATNSDDATKQDVTYTFNMSGIDEEGITVSGDAVAYVYNGSDYKDLKAITAAGLEDRFAFNNGNGTSAVNGNWWWRSGSENGVQLRSSGYTGGFAILDLKEGDKVVLTVSSATYFSFPAASSVDGTSQTVNSKDGTAGHTVTWSSAVATIEVTSDGYVPVLATSDNYMYIKSVVITETAPSIAMPDGTITKVNGTSRSVTLTCGTEGATIYYTTDGKAPTTSSTQYESAIELTASSKIRAIAADSEGNTSDLYSERFSAGTTIQLSDISYSVTSLTQDGSLYYPTYNSFACDNSEVLLTPTATITVTKDGSTIEYDSETGIDTSDGSTYIVTASADGYESSSIELTNAYTLKHTPSVTYDKINSSNFESIFGTTAYSSDEASEQSEVWYYSTTRWSDWSQTKGNNLDGTSNSSATYYYYTYKKSKYTITLDGYFNHYQNGYPELLIGYGFGSGSRSTEAYITSPEEGSVAEYKTCVYSSTFTTAYTTYSESSTLAYTIPQKYACYSANVYVPAKELTKTIGTTGYASFSSEYNVEVPEGVYVYKATEVGTDAVTLTLVDGVTIIPANTGVILYSETASTGYSFLVTYDESEADFGDNILIASSEYPEVGTDDGGYTTYYGLKASAEEATFAPISEGTTLSGNKAYLGTTASEAKSLKIVFGSTNGISEISSAKSQETGAFYNLQGVKVENPQKGLYIRDGKKVIIK